MNDTKLLRINELIKQEKIQEAQIEVSKLGIEYHKDLEYLYIRGMLFYKSKLYYAAIDSLLIALLPLLLSVNFEVHLFFFFNLKLIVIFWLRLIKLSRGKPGIV